MHLLRSGVPPPRYVYSGSTYNYSISKISGHPHDCTVDLKPQYHRNIRSNFSSPIFFEVISADRPPDHDNNHTLIRYQLRCISRGAVNVPSRWCFAHITMLELTLPFHLPFSFHRWPTASLPEDVAV